MSAVQTASRYYGNRFWHTVLIVGGGGGDGSSLSGVRDVYQVHGWQRAKFIGVSGRGATCVGVLLGKWFARWKTEKTEDVLFTPIGVYTSLFKTL